MISLTFLCATMFFQFHSEEIFDYEGFVAKSDDRLIKDYGVIRSIKLMENSSGKHYVFYIGVANQCYYVVHNKMFVQLLKTDKGICNSKNGEVSFREKTEKGSKECDIDFEVKDGSLFLRIIARGALQSSSYYIYIPISQAVDIFSKDNGNDFTYDGWWFRRNRTGDFS